MSRRTMLVVAPSAELYGSDRALLSALPELVEAFDITMAVPSDGPAADRARQMGAEVVVLPDYAIRRRHLQPRQVLPWLSRVASAVRTLHRRHQRRRFDMVYSNTLAAGIGMVLRPLWRVPHVLHVHECPTGPKWFIRLLLLSARITSDRVMCNSAFTRRWLTDRQPGLDGLTVVVHNGIDLPEPAGRPEPSDTLRVTCVARIHPKKGHRVLVEAARRLVREGGRLHLDFYGDNLGEHQALRQEIERQIESVGLSTSVTWHGFIDDPGAMYRYDDVAVVPSVVPEEFSLVCVEAQSMRLPVVVTGPGGASEVVVNGQTGIVVPPGDADALARALADLADDPSLRARMGDAGRQRMVTHFSRQPFARQVRRICTETSEVGHRPRPRLP